MLRTPLRRLRVPTSATATSHTRAAPARDSVPLSVLTWSVDGCGRLPFLRRRRRYAARLPHMLDAIHGSRCDVVVLQAATPALAAAVEAAGHYRALLPSGVPSPCGQGVSVAFVAVTSSWAVAPLLHLAGLTLEARHAAAPRRPVRVASIDLQRARLETSAAVGTVAPLPLSALHDPGKTAAAGGGSSINHGGHAGTSSVRGVAFAYLADVAAADIVVGDTRLRLSERPPAPFTADAWHQCGAAEGHKYTSDFGVNDYYGADDSAEAEAEAAGAAAVPAVSALEADYTRSDAAGPGDGTFDDAALAAQRSAVSEPRATRRSRYQRVVYRSGGAGSSGGLVATQFQTLRPWVAGTRRGRPGVSASDQFPVMATFAVPVGE